MFIALFTIAKRWKPAPLGLLPGRLCPWSFHGWLLLTLQVSAPTVPPLRHLP